MNSVERADAAPAFVWRAGVHVCGTRLWCDARRAQDLCFVSDARVNLRPARTAPPGTLLGTERTLALHAVTAGPQRAAGDVLTCPLGRPFSFGALRLELFPSGQHPGAASLWVQLTSGKQLVYAGAPNPQAGALGEAMQVRAAAALVCDAPLATLGVTLPSQAKAAAAVLKAVKAEVARGAVVVLLCSALGTAQELLRMLAAKQYGAFVHPLIGRYAAAYEALGIWTQPPLRRFQRPLPPGSILLWPLNKPLPPPVRLAAKPARVYLVSGVAAVEAQVARCRDALLAAGHALAGALPFPDAIDLPGLVGYARDTEAKVLYLTAGVSAALAAALPRQLRVLPLGPPRQLPLFSE